MFRFSLCKFFEVLKIIKMYNRLRPPPLNLNPQLPPSLHSPVLSPYLPRFFPDGSSANISRDLVRFWKIIYLLSF